MPKETAIFDLPYPESTDAPDGAAQIQAAVERVEELLATIEELVLKEPAAGDLIVVNGTKDPRYIAATGDVTNNSAGVFTIGAEKVATTMIKNLAVTAAKLAEEAVETAKIKGLAVTEAKLAALAVTAAKLAANAVETAKIKDEAVTRAKLDKNIHHAVEVVRETNQAIGNKEWVPLSYETERFDTGGCWAIGSPTKLVCVEPGIYYAAGTFGFAGSAVGQRIARIVKYVGGVPKESLAELLVPGQAAIEAGFAGNAMGLASRPFTLEAGQYITMDAYQNSGGALNVMGDATHKTEFGMVWLRPLP